MKLASSAACNGMIGKRGLMCESSHIACVSFDPMIVIRVAVVILSLTSGLTAIRPVAAQTAASELIHLWDDANDCCRGGHGDDPETDAACEERERYATRLDELNFCYGREGEYGSDTSWHRCGADVLMATHRSKRHPLGNARAHDPSVVGHHGARCGAGLADLHELACALLVGLAALDDHAQPAIDVADVANVERDDLRSTQGPGIGEENQSAVANVYQTPSAVHQGLADYRYG